VSIGWVRWIGAYCRFYLFFCYFCLFFAFFWVFLPVFFSMNHVISAKNLPPHHPTQAPLTNGAIVEISIFCMSLTLQAIQPKREGVLMDRKPMVVNGAIKIRGLF
jgi:hypothetical protein